MQLPATKLHSEGLWPLSSPVDFERLLSGCPASPPPPRPGREGNLFLDQPLGGTSEEQGLCREGACTARGWVDPGNGWRGEAPFGAAEGGSAG